MDLVLVLRFVLNVMLTGSMSIAYVVPCLLILDLDNDLCFVYDLKQQYMISAQCKTTSGNFGSVFAQQRASFEWL